PSILFYKPIPFIQSSVMITYRLGLGVRFDRVRFSSTRSFLGHNGNRPLWSKNILYKKSGFTDHRSPSSFVPTDRSIFEPNLQLTIIIVALWDIFRQSSANSTYLNRSRTCHLAHYIYIMYTAIHNGTQAIHDITV